MCRNSKDRTEVLENGEDQDLIGSDGNKLSTEYLQEQYLNSLDDTSKELCYSCMKIYKNSNEATFKTLFPFKV